MSVFVTVDDTFSNKVNGLCGNYDHSSDVEFIMSNGQRARNPIQFANHWRLDSGVS